MKKQIPVKTMPPIIALMIFISFCAILFLLKNEFNSTSSAVLSETYSPDFFSGFSYVISQAEMYMLLMIALCVTHPAPLPIIIQIALFTLAHILGSYVFVNDIIRPPYFVILFSSCVILLFTALENLFTKVKILRPFLISFSGVVYGMLFADTFHEWKGVKEIVSLKEILTVNAGLACSLLLLTFIIYYSLLKWVYNTPSYKTNFIYPVAVLTGLISIYIAVTYLLL